LSGNFPPDVPADILEPAAALWDRWETGARLIDADAADAPTVERVRVEYPVSFGAWTGTADLLAVLRHGDGRRALHIVDWKSGFSEVPAAAVNAQARAYVSGISGALLESFGVAPVIGAPLVIVHIITPRGFTSAGFDGPAMEAARAEMMTLAAAVRREDAPRFPSAAACQYCRAAGNPERCPESVALPESVAATLPAALAAGVETLPANRLAALLAAALLVEKLAKPIRAEARRRLAAGPDSVPGWCLAPGKVARSVADTAAAVDTLRAAGLSDADALSACRLSLPDAESAIASRFDVSKRRAAEIVENALAGLIEFKASSASLISGEV
jgi:hypothetical protein